jgi:hypothetical protein
MTKAIDIITDAMSFGLNRLSPGETLDADTANVCLQALNSIVDEINGLESFLFKEQLIQSIPITGTVASLGVAWPTVTPGSKILSATVQYQVGLDYPLESLTMDQYSVIPLKNVSVFPRYYAYDGYSNLFLYPAAAGQTITLRVHQFFSQFADLLTDYGMPAGFRSAFADLLAKKMAKVLLGSTTPDIEIAAAAAKRRVAAQTVSPAIINGRRPAGNILSGWYV